MEDSLVIWYGIARIAGISEAAILLKCENTNHFMPLIKVLLPELRSEFSQRA